MKTCEDCRHQHIHHCYFEPPTVHLKEAFTEQRENLQVHCPVYENARPRVGEDKFITYGHKYDPACHHYEHRHGIARRALDFIWLRVRQVWSRLKTSGENR